MPPRILHEVAVGDLAAVLELLGALHEADDVDDLVVRLTARLAMLITTDSVVIEDAPGTAARGTSDRLPDPGRLHLTVGPPAERPLRITLVRNGSFGRRDLAVAELLEPHLPAAVSHAALRAATKRATASTALTRRERQALYPLAAGPAESGHRPQPLHPPPPGAEAHRD